MMNNKLLFTCAVGVMLIIFCMSGIHAQQVTEKPALGIGVLLEQQDFVFVATVARPMGGRQLFLTSNYRLEFSRDSLVCDLPYFGRAFSAPMNPAEGGIRFISTDYEMKVTPRKKQRWTVTVRPADAKEVQQMILEINSDGKATLQVSSTNRQSISFGGNITARAAGLAPKN